MASCVIVRLSVCVHDLLQHCATYVTMTNLLYDARSISKSIYPKQFPLLSEVMKINPFITELHLVPGTGMSGRLHVTVISYRTHGFKANLFSANWKILLS